MPLPTSEASSKNRLKALLFGDAGAGKTMAAIQMPDPYIIDTESGTDHYIDIIKQNRGAVFQTNSMKKILDIMKMVATEKHPYKTLVIDPFTTIYEMAIDEAEATVGTKFGRHIAEANKLAKRLYNYLTQIDMNIIITAHSKKLYGDKMEVIGNTFDGWKKLDYLFDLVFEIERNRDGKRIATVSKTRIPEFPDQARFQWSYDKLAEMYGREKLERSADQVKLTESTTDDAREIEESVKELQMKLMDMTIDNKHYLDESALAYLRKVVDSAGSTSAEWEQIRSHVIKSMGRIEEIRKKQEAANEKEAINE